jgi:hypothetical protein
MVATNMIDLGSEQLLFFDYQCWLEKLHSDHLLNTHVPVPPLYEVRKGGALSNLHIEKKRLSTLSDCIEVF